MSKTLKILLTFILFVGIFALCTNVKASSTPEQLKEKGSATTEDNVVYKLSKDLTGDASEDIEIPSGQDYVLDLNGFDITNYATGCCTIWVKPGANLTIINSNEDDIGKVSQIASTEPALIGNDGTLVIEGGIFTTSNDRGVIENRGTLTINGGEFSITNTSSTHSVINNPAGKEATISGGTFTTASDHSVIYNAGTLEMNGGSVSTEFENPTNWLVENLGNLTISGDAEITKGASTSAAVGNLPEAAGEATLTVSGGTITAEGNAIQNYGSTVVIEDGTVTSETGYAVVTVGGEVDVNGGTVTATNSTKGAIYVGGNSDELGAGHTYENPVVKVAEGATVTAPATTGGYVVYVLDPTLATVEVADGGVEINQDAESASEYGVFVTLDGTTITGKYDDVKISVDTDKENVTKVSVQEGKTLDLYVNAYLGETPILVDAEASFEKADLKYATVENKDGYLVVKGVSKTGEPVEMTIEVINLAKNELLASKTVSVEVTEATATEDTETTPENKPEAEKDLDDTDKNGLDNTVVVAMATVAIVSLAGYVVAKKK